RRGGKGQQAAFVNRSIANGGEEWSAVQFINRDDEGLRGTEGGRTVVSDSNSHWISSRHLHFGRSPGKQPTGGIDGRAGGRAGIKAEGQRVGGSLRICPRGDKSQQAAFVNRRVANGSERWC